MLSDNAEYQSSFTDIHLTTIDMCMSKILLPPLDVLDVTLISTQRQSKEQ